MVKKIEVMDSVLRENEAWAEENRAFLKECGMKMYNLIGSPGAGKTALLEKTIEMTGDKIRIGVIEGDLATKRDAERIKKKGVPVHQINTGSACHLNAYQVHTALKKICRKKLDIVFVENIGNLVCPAEFDIGEHAKIAVLSVTEGDDKVEKYPLLFAGAKALVITKLDLLPHTNFDLAAAKKAFRKLNKSAPLITLDSLSARGFSAWLKVWLRLGGCDRIRLIPA